MANPRTQVITHIDIKSRKERNIVNRVELAAIMVALRQKNIKNHLKILTDRSFCINTIRSYTIDIAFYKNHLNKDLLHLTDKLLRARYTKQLKTHIGKVKSHTNIENNEEVDSTTRAVVNGDVTPKVTFDEVDPPIGGLRT